jgi:hypothetical protein
VKVREFGENYNPEGSPSQATRSPIRRTIDFSPPRTSQYTRAEVAELRERAPYGANGSPLRPKNAGSSISPSR